MAVTGFTFGDGSANTVQTTWGATCPTVAAGDLLIVVASENGTTPALSISGGGTGVTWSSLSGPDTNGTTAESNVWIAVATASSTGSTITITSDTAGRLMGAGVAVSGYVSSGALVALTPQTTASASIPFPSVTIPNANGWQLLGLAVLRVASTTTASLTAPGGSTKAAESSSAYTSSAEFTDVIVAVSSPVGSGSRSPGTGTASTSVTNCQIYTVALAPASVPASGSGQITLGGAPNAKAVSSTSGLISLGGLATPNPPPAAAGVLSLGGAPGGKAAAATSGQITLGGAPAPSARATAVGGLITLGGLPAVTLRFSYRNGATWQQITPRVWNGAAWAAIPVTLRPVNS